MFQVGKNGKMQMVEHFMLITYREQHSGRGLQGKLLHLLFFFLDDCCTLSDTF